MPSALYYPHTAIRSQGLIKTALLLWDEVACIVPQRNWPLEKPFSDKALNEAVELLVKRHVPSLAEKRQAHRDVDEFIHEEGSRLLLNHPLGRGYPNRYLMYPNKFLRGTWIELERQGFAAFDHRSSDYGVPPVLGLLMMSSLASACAGTQKHLVTDRAQAYSLIERTRATLMGAPFVEGLDASQIAPELDRLVTISLKLLNARRISAKKVLDFRKREARSHSADYRKMRVRYFTAVNSYVHRILSEAKSVKDVKEIEKQFELDISDDLKSLKKELGIVTLESLFSKEMALTVLAIGGAFAAPIAGLTSLAATIKGIGVVPLVATAIKQRKDRRKVLLSHNTSWLYIANQPRLATV
jgi:hypothetical protein